MNLRKKVFLIIIVLFFLGCSKPSRNIEATYVSPLNYKGYNCLQLKQEMNRVIRKTKNISKAQDSEAGKDAVALTAGLVIFWPALFFLIGDDNKFELAHLKGEYDALETMATEKQCKFMEIREATLADNKETPAPKEKTKSTSGISRELIDNQTGYRWKIIKTRQVDLGTAKNMCKSLNVREGEIARLPTLSEVQNLWERFQNEEIISAFEQKEYSTSDEGSYTRHGYTKTFSFDSGTSDKLYAAHLVCVIEKEFDVIQ